jgi:hypothetical protein
LSEHLRDELLAAHPTDVSCPPRRTRLRLLQITPLGATPCRNVSCSNFSYVLLRACLGIFGFLSIKWRKKDVSKFRTVLALTAVAVDLAAPSDDPRCRCCWAVSKLASHAKQHGDLRAAWQ